MSQPIQARLREFTEALLIRSGALVEWSEAAAEGLAILSPQTSARLRCPETVRLTHQPGAEALCANLATDFLDRVLPLLAAEPRVGFFQVPDLYLKRGDMAEALRRAFTWHNARVVVQVAAPERVEYHAWYFLASIVSEDRWEDVIGVTINAQSGAAVSLPEPLTTLDLEPPRGSEAAPPGTYRSAVRRANALMEQRAGPFVARLESRLARDRARIREYYAALLREESTKRHRVWTPEVKEKQEARRRAVELELRRKLAELDERYAVRAELAPVVLLRIMVQALAVECEVFRRQARRMHTIYWNPVLKELEPMCCDGCGASTFSVVFTDGDVRPLCATCAGL